MDDAVLVRRSRRRLGHARSHGGTDPARGRGWQELCRRRSVETRAASRASRRREYPRRSRWDRVAVMSDWSDDPVAVETRITVHEAVCAERYASILAMLRDTAHRVTRLEVME